MAKIKDVARIAGVGVGTVSRVINNSGPVKFETREKVLRVIEELEYVPNEIARSFKRKSSKLVGLMLPTITNPFFSELAFYIEDELYLKGYKMLLCSSQTNSDKEIEYLDMLKRNLVDGIITISYHDYYNHDKIDNPLVTIDRYISDEIPHVSADNYGGGKLATEKLIEAGCKSIAYVGGAPRYHSSVSDRKQGLIDIAKANNIPYYIFEESESENIEGSLSRPIMDESLVVKRFVREYPNVEGVLTSSDLFAAALVKELRRIGKRVPEDVQVIGFDGIQSNDYFEPQLSTIKQPVEAMGRQSVKILLGLIKGEKVPSNSVLNINYIEGETCKKASDIVDIK
ncbi:MAG TPA: LacI family transcriptional regulator [Epulopiscium sp.]|nr:LacI family transcriptional regulator [Candidatus Epulonipiscium sp.]